MFDFGYLKTPPGLLTSLATLLNLIAFICVITTEEKTSIHAGFLLAVTILGILASIAIIVCHIVLSIASKIPPYPFALAQVLQSMSSETGFLKLHKFPNVYYRFGVLCINSVREPFFMISCEVKYSRVAEGMK